MAGGEVGDVKNHGQAGELGRGMWLWIIDFWLFNFYVDFVIGYSF